MPPVPAALPTLPAKDTPPSPQAQPFPYVPPLSASLTPPPAAGPSSQPQPPLPQVPTQDSFDKSMPVTVMIWLENNVPCTEAMLYPCMDSRVRFSDFKVLLGQLGVEQTQDIEVFHAVQERWLPTAWNTPHAVSARGHILLVRIVGVEYLDKFEDHLPWVSSNFLVTPPPTVDRKGKKRAFP
ncbi:unnamed protein product [Cyclocybe aegerita]|uniref:Uncharacterized protein n=1 Tax=Cyclocybe aegerita TaxID=1973307 RepID=A0A8S0WC31_CYCAE|nr:unnamed protein product [Cyclocybe aegerita]